MNTGFGLTLYGGKVGIIFVSVMLVIGIIQVVKEGTYRNWRVIAALAAIAFVDAWLIFAWVRSN